MKIKAADKQKIEEYARSLLDAAKGEGRVPVDPEGLRRLVRNSPEVHAVLARMRDEQNLPLLEQVYGELREMLNAEDDTVYIEVTTAVPMNAELRKKVHDKCAADFNAPVFLIEHVEPKIIGGIIIEANGHRRDASVRAQLANIRRTLSSSFMGGDEV